MKPSNVRPKDEYVFYDHSISIDISRITNVTVM